MTDNLYDFCGGSSNQSSEANPFRLNVSEDTPPLTPPKQADNTSESELDDILVQVSNNAIDGVSVDKTEHEAKQAIQKWAAQEATKAYNLGYKEGYDVQLRKDNNFIRVLKKDIQRQLLTELKERAEQYNEYDPATQSDDPVMAVPLSVIDNYLKGLEK